MTTINIQEVERILQGYETPEQRREFIEQMLKAAVETAVIMSCEGDKARVDRQIDGIIQAIVKA